MSIVDWNIQEVCGYKPLTTYYRDFGIAEMFGEKAIRETYNDAKKFWFQDYKYLTEIVMVLNWKQWEHHHKNNYNFVRLYYVLWCDAVSYAMENLKGEELKYYYRTTD